jgi:hypothetical protein
LPAKATLLAWENSIVSTKPVLEVTPAKQHQQTVLLAEMSNKYIFGFAGRAQELTAVPEATPAGVGRVSDADRGDVTRFLNRLLGVEPRAQVMCIKLQPASRSRLFPDPRCSRTCAGMRQPEASVCGGRG